MWVNGYTVRDKNFSGLVLYHSLKGKFVNGWRYTDGEVTHKVKLDFDTDIRLKIKSGHYECTTYNIYEMFVECTYLGITGEYGLLSCSDDITYEYIGSVDECVYVVDGDDDGDDGDNDNGGGGGGYEPDTNNEELKALPSFTDISSFFTSVAFMSADEVYILIGGKVLWNHLNFPNDFQNACALRLSYAFNMLPGHTIPYINGLTLSGDVNNNGIKEWYFFKVSDMVGYLKSTYGEPVSTTTDAISGKTGIIWQDNCGWGNATGHLDLWDGENAIDHYYNECEDVYFWEN